MARDTDAEALLRKLSEPNPTAKTLEAACQLLKALKFTAVSAEERGGQIGKTSCRKAALSTRGHKLRH